MIYVSSSCVKSNKIKDSVKKLAEYGFKNIELSGGTKYYIGYEQDLLELKEQYGLSYLLHNYFPPPSFDFVLNLASLDDEIFDRTLQHLENAINLSKKFKSNKYGFHAGFFIDMKPSEIGGKIIYANLSDKNSAIQRFCQGFKILSKQSNNIELYLENNVISRSNVQTFKNKNPFLLTDYESYSELTKLIKFNLLLDIGHLKVSANSQGLAFDEQFEKLLMETNYLHLSENDGYSDQNSSIYSGSDLLQKLKNFDLQNKTITLEIYGSISALLKSYELIQKELKL